MTAHDSALHLCALIDGVHETARPCEFDETNQTLSAFTDISASVADEACNAIAKETRTRWFKFDAGWKLLIYTSNAGRPVLAASCGLATDG